MKLYVVFTHWNCLIEAIVINTLNIPLLSRRWKTFSKLSPFASWPGVMINIQWFELAISRTNIHGPKMFDLLRFDWTALSYEECQLYQSSDFRSFVCSLLPRTTFIDFIWYLISLFWFSVVSTCGFLLRWLSMTEVFATHPYTCFVTVL